MQLISTNRALALVIAAVSLAVAFSAGQAVIAVADAQAQTYCGAYKDGTARTSSRFGRVRTQACLEKNPYGYSRAVNRTIVDKPSGCFWGASTSGPSYSCPPSAASAWPEFHGFELTVGLDGAQYRCNWGAQGSGAKTFNCYTPWKYGWGYHTATADTCYDVKDDGNPWYCIPRATFSKTL